VVAPGGISTVQASSVKFAEVSTRTPDANKQTQQQTTQKPTAVTTKTRSTAASSSTQKNKSEDNKKPEVVTTAKAVAPVVVSTAKPKEDKPESGINEPPILHKHREYINRWLGTQQRSSQEEDNDDGNYDDDDNDFDEDDEDDEDDNDEPLSAFELHRENIIRWIGMQQRNSEEENNDDDENDFDEDEEDDDDNDESLSTFELDRRVSKKIEKRYMHDIESVLRFVFDVSNLRYHKGMK